MRQALGAGAPVIRRLRSPQSASLLGTQHLGLGELAGVQKQGEPWLPPATPRARTRSRSSSYSSTCGAAWRKEENILSGIPATIMTAQEAAQRKWCLPATQPRAPPPRPHVGIVGRGVPHNVPRPNSRLEVRNRGGVGAGDADAGGALEEEADQPGVGQEGETLWATTAAQLPAEGRRRWKVLVEVARDDSIVKAWLGAARVEACKVCSSTAVSATNRVGRRQHAPPRCAPEQCCLNHLVQGSELEAASN